MGNLQAVLPESARTCGLSFCSRQPCAPPDDSAPSDKGSTAPSRPSEPPRYARIKNWQTGSISYDTLSAQACQELPCSGQRCLGSVMFPKQLVCAAGQGPYPKDELRPLARDFLHQYYSSIKRLPILPTCPVLGAARVGARVLGQIQAVAPDRADSPAHVQRLMEVEQEIEATGTYQLLEPELIFGAKQAWRNAARCLGRIQWNKLQVRMRS
ncbi:hypothetical protein Y1Q_0007230 [Alligator mississippiensis]|uniref:nitric-oxide synthase (NADPH) n=1 Tax=Alligator mississippiensis TaxID=8496 RepID=A0A151P2S1_ALLMI|nr:hypothetical protein Y1Q_0007230 [Alligator mississippiensis]